LQRTGTTVNSIAVRSVVDELPPKSEEYMPFFLVLARMCKTYRMI
jgi:hypothetical protein